MVGQDHCGGLVSHTKVRSVKTVIWKASTLNENGIPGTKGSIPWLDSGLQPFGRMEASHASYTTQHRGEKSVRLERRALWSHLA